MFTALSHGNPQITHPGGHSLSAEASRQTLPPALELTGIMIVSQGPVSPERRGQAAGGRGGWSGSLALGGGQLGEEALEAG